ncbi:MAG: DUF3052 domain-containing protein, partial [Anaerolineae bacterium]|nr:DUF3052 domain-containing protein [Anaerolineae bacterium]
LGIRAGMRAIFLHAPEYYLNRLGSLMDRVNTPAELTDASLDFVQAFYAQRSRLVEELPSLKAALQLYGTLWICWPHQKINVPCDLTEAIVRECGRAAGFDDLQVEWMDALWVGVKFIPTIPRN